MRKQINYAPRMKKGKVLTGQIVQKSETELVREAMSSDDQVPNNKVTIITAKNGVKMRK